MRNLNQIEIRTLDDYNSLGTKNLFSGALVQEHQRILELLFRDYCNTKYSCIEDTIEKIINNCLGKDPKYIRGKHPDGKPKFHTHYADFKNNFFLINTLRNKIQHFGYIPTEAETDISKQYFRTCLQYYFKHCVQIENLSHDSQKTIEYLFINNPNIPYKKEPQIVEEKGETITKTNEQEEKRDSPRIRPQKNTIHPLFIGLLIIAIGLAAYLLLKPNNKPQNGDTQTTTVPENPRDSVLIPDTTKPKTPNDNPATEKGTTKPPIVNETEVIKKEEKELEPGENPEQNGSSKYISNTEFKNKEGSIEMAVLIINDNNSINGAISQKVATAFFKNKGYNNTTSLLSKKFVTDGLFENIFNGGGIDFSKHKFSEFADYFCLGKVNIETEQSDVRSDMTKATINMEISVIRATNGGEIDHLTIPTTYSTGIGFSKKQAIEVATDNIIKYLKNYKNEN